MFDDAYYVAGCMLTQGAALQKDDTDFSQKAKMDPNDPRSSWSLSVCNGLRIQDIRIMHQYIHIFVSM